jgi:hypothetical protein
MQNALIPALFDKLGDEDRDAAAGKFGAKLVHEP